MPHTPPHKGYWLLHHSPLVESGKHGTRRGASKARQGWADNNIVGLPGRHWCYCFTQNLQRGPLSRPVPSSLLCKWSCLNLLGHWAVQSVGFLQPMCIHIQLKHAHDNPTNSTHHSAPPIGSPWTQLCLADRTLTRSITASYIFASANVLTDDHRATAHYTNTNTVLRARLPFMTLNALNTVTAATGMNVVPPATAMNTTPRRTHQANARAMTSGHCATYTSESQHH